MMLQRQINAIPGSAAASTGNALPALQRVKTGNEGSAGRVGSVKLMPYRAALQRQPVTRASAAAVGSVKTDSAAHAGVNR